MSNRRTFIQKAFGLGAGLFAAPRVFADSQNGPSSRSRSTHAGPAFNVSVVTAHIGDLPYTMEGNTKVFHLIAEVVKQQISPLKTIDAWGFNGSAPGPTIQVNQGDHVRVVFENRLPEQTSIHWHGFEDTIQNDGQPGISQEPVKPGGRFVYEFNPGDWMIHCHLPHHMMNQMSSNAGKMTRTAGMPAGGDMNTGTFVDPGDDDVDSWKLVAFIRHLPQLTPSEEAEMQHLNPKSPDEIQEQKEEEDFLKGDAKSAMPATTMHHH